MKKKGGFTLIEMMVVIAVVGILMTVVFQFGSKRISDLQLLSEKEQLIYSYQYIYSTNLTTNYYKGNKISVQSVYFSGGGNDISCEPSCQGSVFKSSNMFWTGLAVDGNKVDKVTVNLSPYQIGCDILSKELSGEKFSFSLQDKYAQKAYCFEMLRENCKIQNVVCN